MAKIKIYEPGEHGSGFVGAAIRTTVGPEKIQEYFSFKQYGKKEALKRAKTRLEEINALQADYNYDRSLTQKRSSYGGRVHIIKINQIVLSVGKRGYPYVRFVAQPAHNRYYVTKKERSFKNEAEFIEAYRTCAMAKIEFENLDYQDEWLAYYESLRPAFRTVKKFYKDHYQFTRWTK